MKQPAHSPLVAYVTGFVLSVLLTMSAYLVTVNHVVTSGTQPTLPVLVTAIIALAVVQLYVQVRYFLHLGAESSPRWNLMAFLFMLLVVVIIVVGSLWIMNHLTYHAMSPDQLKSYLRVNEGL